ELFEIDGYFRVRPDLFNKFDLGWLPGQAADPSGFTLWPQSPTSNRDRTQAGVNMRLRLEPTLNIHEQVRVKMQVDVLDNMLFGGTPDYAFTRSDRKDFTIFFESQSPPPSGINSIRDAITLKRAYGQVSTPFG